MNLNKRIMKRITSNIVVLVVVFLFILGVSILDASMCIGAGFIVVSIIFGVIFRKWLKEDEYTDDDVEIN